MSKLTDTNEIQSNNEKQIQNLQINDQEQSVAANVSSVRNLFLIDVRLLIF